MEENKPAIDVDGIVARVKSILLDPKDTWDKIDGEASTTGSILMGYVLPLAAIGPIAAFIGSQLFGTSLFGITYKPSLMSALGMLVTSYVLTIVSIFVLSYIIDFLAPKFGGTPDKLKAFKVAAYSATAAWVFGIFGLIPSLALLALIGSLYSLYLLYLGLPKLMKAPEDKALPYTAVTVLAAILLWFLVGAVAALLVPKPSISDPLDGGGSITIPGLGTVDTGEVDRATQGMRERGERMTQRIEDAEQARERLQSIDPVAHVELKALLPERIAGMDRESASSQSVNMGGFAHSSATARYRDGNNNLRITISDMAGSGAMAAMPFALGMTYDRSTDDGYKRLGEVDGRVTMEQWNGRTGRAEYGTIFNERFFVKADGRVEDADVAKRAVMAFNNRQLRALAR